MAAPQALRAKIEFPANVPVLLTLAFAEGKRVASQFGGGWQMMFSTTDHRCFYLSEAAAASVTQQMVDRAIQPGQPVIITKSQKPGANGKTVTRWLIDAESLPVQPIAERRTPQPVAESKRTGEQTDGTFVVEKLPACSPRPPSGSARSGEISGLEAALCLAVTAAHKATLHAKTLGFQMPAFTGEDLRAMANTVVIQGGGR